MKQLWGREDGAHRDGRSGARTQPRRDVAGRHAEPKRKFSEHLTPGDITDIGCSYVKAAKRMFVDRSSASGSRESLDGDFLA